MTLDLPLFERCKTDGTNRDAWCPVQAPYARSKSSPHRRPPAQHPSWDTWSRSNMSCHAAQPAAPRRVYTIHIISCTISFWRLSTHLAEASFAQHGKKMKIIYRIILKSRYYCGWRGETSGFLELWICIGCFCTIQRPEESKRVKVARRRSMKRASTKCK